MVYYGVYKDEDNRQNKIGKKKRKKIMKTSRELPSLIL